MSETIALLDASVGDTPAQRNVAREVPARLVPFKVSEGEFPAWPHDHETDGEMLDDLWPYDGAIISGSQTSVYWDEPWIDDVASWVRQAHLHDVPMLGICWGHQLLASALGGTVVDMGEYELGYEEIQLTGPSPLFVGFPETFVAFETHSDEVQVLPEGATVLARNDRGIQAFRFGTAYGVQFHPEYDLETARQVTRGKGLPDDRLAGILATLTPNRYEEARTAARVFENFLDIVRRQPVPT